MFCKSKYLQQCSQKSVLCHCHNVDSQPWEFPGWNLKLGLYTEGKKEADYPRLVGGSFNKHGNLHTRLALGGHKTSWLLHPPAWIIKVYIETLIKFNHIYYPDGLNNTLLSEDCGFEATPTVGTVGRMSLQVQRRVWGATDCRVQLAVHFVGQPVVTNLQWPPPTHSPFPAKIKTKGEPLLLL